MSHMMSQSCSTQKGLQAIPGHFHLHHFKYLYTPAGGGRGLGLPPHPYLCLLVSNMLLHQIHRCLMKLPEPGIRGGKNDSGYWVGEGPKTIALWVMRAFFLTKNCVHSKP